MYVRERKFYANFTFGNESSSWKVGNEGSMELSFLRTKVPPMELSFPGTKVLGYESS